MQFIDLEHQQARLKSKIDENIQTVLSHGKYIMGPEVAEIENRLADYVGVKHAVSCASGTDALLLALMALDIGPGDAVFTTPFTFIATAEVIQLLGATPIFVDIDQTTFNIDPEKLDSAIAALKTSDPSMYALPRISGMTLSDIPLKPRCIIPVDIFGLPADYDRIKVVAKKHDLYIVEDAAQSFGAELKGKKACTFGHMAATSFFPAKPLGCYGDGGMCFTKDDRLSEVLKSIRVHGKGTHKYDNARIGVNGRLDTIQAAILLAKFNIFPEEVQMRQEVAGRYSELLAPLEARGLICTPKTPTGTISAWAQYSILATNEEERSKLQNILKASNIPTAVYYPKPLHLQTAFKGLGYKEGDFPVSEDISKRVFSVPMHPYLNRKQQIRIADTLKERFFLND